MPLLNSRLEDDFYLEEKRNFLKVIDGGYSENQESFVNIPPEKSKRKSLNLQKLNKRLLALSALSFLFSGFLYFVSSSLETEVLKKLKTVELQMENREDLKSDLSKSYNLAAF